MILPCTLTYLVFLSYLFYGSILIIIMKSFLIEESLIINSDRKQKKTREKVTTQKIKSFLVSTR